MTQYEFYKKYVKDNLNAAMFWYGFGFKVIPIVPESKRTAVKWDPWFESFDSFKVSEYWKNHPNHEVGFIVGDEIIVFDADTPESLSALKEIESRFVVTPKLVVKTAKGEHHYFRRSPDTMAKSDSHDSKKYPERLDIKTGRALVVLPISKGKTLHTFEAESDVELSEATQEFINAIYEHNGRTTPTVTKELPRTVDETENTLLERIKYWLDQIDPDCGYDDWVRVGMAIFHETKGSDDGMLQFDSWSSKGDKYKGQSDVETKWRSFRLDIPNPVTIHTLYKMAYDAEDFEPCETDIVYPKSESQEKSTDKEQYTSGIDHDESDPLSVVQQQFGLINMEGTIFAFDRHILNARTNEGTAEKLKLSDQKNGNLMIKRILAERFPGSDSKKIVNEFWISPKTLYYSGVEFNPANTSENYLNLWVGPTIESKTGKWKLIEMFLRQIICNNDEKVYEYLINYIAHALQKPEKKPGVMIILLGGQGTGKGTLGRIFHKIWSATYLQVHDIKTVIGDFNSSLERAYIVFMDEALISGDKYGANRLKSLVTEPLLLINEKYQPDRQIRSYHRFIAATNEDHFKKTDYDDRRDFTLRVSESRKGDHNYWENLNREINHGGVEAMVYDLQKVDLSDFNVRNKPDTKELLEQKLRSLNQIGRWWHDCLDRGAVNEDEWPEFISTADAVKGIKDATGGKKPSDREVVKQIKKLCPSVTQKQKTISAGKRPRGLILPSLPQARSEFENHIGGSIDWPDSQGSEDF